MWIAALAVYAPDAAQLDCVRLIVSRLLAPFAPNRNHLYHLLSERSVDREAVVYYFVLVDGPIALSIEVPALTPFPCHRGSRHLLGHRFQANAADRTSKILTSVGVPFDA